MNEDWKKAFHNKLNDYETTPPEGLFDQILKRIPPVGEGEKPADPPAEVPVTPANTDKRKRGTVAIRLALLASAAAVVAILLINHSFLNVTNPATTTGNLAEQNIKKTEKANATAATPLSDDAYTSDHRGKGTATKNAEQSILHAVTDAFNTLASTILPQTTVAGAAVATTEQPATDIEPVSEAETTKPNTANENRQPNDPPARTEPEKPQRPATPATATHPRRHNNTIKLGVLLAGMPTINSSSDFYASTPIGSKETNEIEVAGQNKVIKKADHRQPITLGVSVALPLSSKLSVETGLMYSRHTSELAYEVGNINHDISQQLNFVGIPLHLNYQLWQKHNATVYVSGGGSVEKMVYGKQKERYNDTKTTTTNKVKMKELQWALSARFGASYALTRGVSFYLEPGVSYHFDTRSALQTIYTDRPLSFQLKAGLRFNLR